VTTALVDLDTAGRGEDQPEGTPPADDAGDPPEPDPVGGRAGDALPSTVWFCRNRSTSVERELIAFLGSHHGVAVIRWPRDTEVAARLDELGIPCMWQVDGSDDLPPLRSPLQERIPLTAGEEEVRACLRRLARLGAAARTGAPIEITDGWLRLGERRICLSAEASRLASVLIAHFDEVVDDTTLARCCGWDSDQQSTRSLHSDLFHLDHDVNPLGLEVVPVTNDAHLIRRCRP
jgi:hypothetical protein